jgi:hypothetical protein
MKNILKSFFVGGLYFALSYCIYRLILGIVDFFRAIPQTVGFEAVILFVVGIFFSAICIAAIFVMGAIPVYTQKKEEEKDEEV